MSRIESTFQTLSRRKEKALIAYVMAGDPDLDQTARMVLEMEKAGADLIELGVPFSDPVADGPTIQMASERALRQGVSLKNILGLVSTLRPQTQSPLILMTYCNPVYAFGADLFFKEAKRAGVDGLIIPDLPLEESTPFSAQARRHHIDLIFLIAPTTSFDRAERILKAATGFVYYVSLTGITGAALGDKTSVNERIQQLKKMTHLPIAVGFGVSTPEEAKEMAQVADGVIVGSAFVKIIETASGDPHYLSRLTEFASSLKKSIRL
ncbi:MAG TPA: tryptophan synthase subunit alpha [Candidatus Manganitrophaceae bacterium]|nr:tryptophan synthase subunit alpha [Candidatus Manganitrophaceae bacterium]